MADRKPAAKGEPKPVKAWMLNGGGLAKGFGLFATKADAVLYIRGHLTTIWTAVPVEIRVISAPAKKQRKRT